MASRLAAASSASASGGVTGRVGFGRSGLGGIMVPSTAIACAAAALAIDGSTNFESGAVVAAPLLERCFVFFLDINASSFPFCASSALDSGRQDHQTEEHECEGENG